jgi:hypothetical protein
VDYKEKFALVTWYTYIKAVMSLVSFMGWRIHQMDVRQHGYSNRGRTPSVTTYTTKSKFNTPMFDVVKPLWGNIHSPSQHGHLEQFINAKEK